MLSTILVGLIAALISGGSGYYISYKFNTSAHAANDTSGDFGAPRGGFIALMSGMLIGMLLFSLGGQIGLLPGDVVGLGLIVSMISGFLGGIAGLIHAVKSVRPKK